MTRVVILAVDAGGTSFKYALLNDEDYSIIGKEQFYPISSFGTKEELLGSFFRLFKDAQKQCDELSLTLSRVALSVPGPFDCARGVSLMKHKWLALKDVPLIDVFSTWANVGGKELGAVLDNKLYAMPFTIEATCVLYNKTAIEKIIGRKFVAQEYATLDAFKSLCAELKKGGMVYPPLTTIRQDYAKLASTSVESVLKLIKGEPVPAIQEFPVELIVRGTT